MKTFIILIIASLFIISCENSDNETTEIENTTHPETTDSSAYKVTEDSVPKDLYELFTYKKNEVILKLKSISKTESNKLYETYFEENQLLLSQIIGIESNALDKFYSDLEKDKKEIKTLGDKLKNNQLDFEELGEGYVEIKTKNDFYYEIFNDYVTPDYKQFLFLKSEENKTTYSADAGLMISFTDLGNRIITWENFISKYPESKLLDKVKEELKFYQRDYLRGLDNTPTVEIANQDSIYIYPENIEEFNRFIKKHPKSPTTKLIKLFMAEFKNEEIDRLITEEQNKK